MKDEAARPRWYVPDGDGFAPSPDDFMGLERYHNERTDWIVGQTDLEYPATGQTITVSTVFLFLDHRFDDGPPVLWETLVFGAEGTPMADYQERYRSLADAQAGHEATVKAVEACFTAGQV